MMKLSFRALFLVFVVTFILNSCTDEQLDIAIQTPSETVSDATTEVILDWNQLWCELDRYAIGMRPNASTRALAYIHLAAFEVCVADMVGYTSNKDRYVELDIDFTQREANVNVGIALNACYATAIDHFMYNVRPDIDSKIAMLRQEKEAELSQNISSDVVLNSKDWGNYIAQQIIAYSQTDTEAETQILSPQPTSYEPPTGIGFWTYSDDAERALFPYWASVRTFVISSAETSTVAPPLTYSEDTTSSFYTAMQEVYASSETARTTNNDDLWVAEFWSNDVEGLMMSPPGRQISIANQLIKQYDVDHESALVLLLKLGFSLNDAAVSTWADKYEYMVMRPSVYIQEFIDPTFQTNLYPYISWPNPSFPSYPSGHSTFASAAAGIFMHHFGNNIDFIDRSHEGRTEFRGTPRGYTTFTQMATENGFSRIPLGVHLRMDCTEGLRLGYEISAAVNDFDLSL
ncbi:vanadium-dependent haloperoxidase [Kordia sp. YSTF-M3]|uniref:Vanadium-dependent haloperoxidase n=1 Tax=Kordia aestuariivivens TaxID=2759037 RepID=A0ABR7Q621_9FLAO|nr:vanadium-dependent haloperoxidase [Kordia aestuariivivens]MBC8754021.1 vanadium-dependent haloperoxidase [Kordia aestuariivivens]